MHLSKAAGLTGPKPEQDVLGGSRTAFCSMVFMWPSICGLNDICEPALVLHLPDHSLHHSLTTQWERKQAWPLLPYRRPVGKVRRGRAQWQWLLMWRVPLLLLNLLFRLNSPEQPVDVARERDLVGWLGETYQQQQQQAGQSRVSSSAQQQASSSSADVGMTVLAWDPRIFLYKGFLTHDECDALIAAASPRLYRSGVDQTRVDDIRTSSGMSFAVGENAVVRRVEDRISRWSMTAVQQGEGIQVLQYNETQKYGAHHDYFSHEHGDDDGGNRMATGIMYLSDVEQGGETVFPKVPVPKGQTKEAGYSDCAMQGLAYKPHKGDILMFWSIRSDGTFDPKSLHGGCPVIKGQKWAATKWIHVAKLSAGTVHRVLYVPPPPPAVPGCVDAHRRCTYWADRGDCEDRATLMVGSKDKPGLCLKACNRCDLGPNAKKKRKWWT